MATYRDWQDFADSDDPPFNWSKESKRFSVVSYQMDESYDLGECKNKKDCIKELVTLYKDMDADCDDYSVVPTIAVEMWEDGEYDYPDEIWDDPSQYWHKNVDVEEAKKGRNFLRPAGDINRIAHQQSKCHGWKELLMYSHQSRGRDY